MPYANLEHKRASDRAYAARLRSSRKQAGLQAPSVAWSAGLRRARDERDELLNAVRSVVAAAGPVSLPDSLAAPIDSLAAVVERIARRRDQE